MSEQRDAQPPLRPRSIVLVFWLLLLSALVQIGVAVIIGVDVVSPASRAELLRALQEEPGVSQAPGSVDGAVAMSLAVAIGAQAVVTAIVVGALVWVAWGIRTGRGYLRIVAAVLLVLQLLSTVLAFSWLALSAALILGGVSVVSWLPSASRYIWLRTEIRRGRPIVLVGD